MSKARSRSNSFEGSAGGHKSPLEEFARLLQRVQDRIDLVKEDYRLSVTPEPTQGASSASPVRGFGARLFGRRSETTPTRPTKAAAEANTASLTPPAPTPPRSNQAKGPVADFIPFGGEPHIVDDFIEDLRRIAEMCIIGENYVTNIQRRQEEAILRQKEKWAKARDNLNAMDESESAAEEVEGEGEKMQLFDLFFERNGLALIVNMLTGKSFEFTEQEKAILRGEQFDADGQMQQSSDDDDNNDKDAPDHPANKHMLPPLIVAVQALQSVSIIMQNVSRATSLYVLLSNNHINELIDLPLEMYTIAERRRQLASKEYKQLPSTFTSPQITELSTHFVTFLKSLAMRMNPQTLQFFLKYPLERSNSKSSASTPVSNPHLSQRRASRPLRHVKRSKSTDLVEKLRGRDAPVRRVVRSHTNEGLMPMSVGLTREKHRRNRSRDSGSSADSEERKDFRASSSDDDDDNHSTQTGASSRSHDEYSEIFNESTTIEAQLLERDVKFLHVEFPLYERALEFCAAHQDSFVRLTAMNICLNTLRLITVGGAEENNTTAGNLRVDNPETAKTPDGTLHNAQPLPFRERLAISQYTCIPSRVERLISPIFTKLAERWNALDEQIRGIDSNKHMGRFDGNDSSSSHTDGSIGGAEKVAQAKEQIKRKKLIRAFKDKVADLQDELLLLEDVFKVGLSVLNEQVVEMMLATFVYPLLLQPLLNYYKGLASSVDESRFSFTDHPFGGIGVDLSDIDKTLVPVSGPAKAAIFTLGCVFQCVTNRPLLRLLFSVLLHPLAPDSSSAPTVRGKLEVGMIDQEGRKFVRLDPPRSESEILVPNERTTYAFGTRPGDRRRSKTEIDESENNFEACVFVLAPALAEILEFRGHDEALMSRCRPNPYRRALLKCLSVPDDMSDVRELAICTFDAAVSVFDGNFVSDILFGVDLELAEIDQNVDNIATVPTQQSSAVNGAWELFDGKTDLAREVISALYDSIIFANRVASSDWKLGYDPVGAHALFCAVRMNNRAIAVAAEMIEQRWQQAGKVLAETPSSGLMPMGGSSVIIHGAPTVNDSDYEEKMFDIFIDNVFFESIDLAGVSMLEEYIIQLKEMVESDSMERFFTTISSNSDTDVLSARVGTFLLEDLDEEEEMYRPDPFDKSLSDERRQSAGVILKVDALNSLMKRLEQTNGQIMHEIEMGGISFTADGSTIDTREYFGQSDINSTLSSSLATALLHSGGINGTPPPASLSVIDLASYEMLPCVCETPASAAHLFSNEVSGVVAEGVTWQSLYIVFMERFMVFAQPVPGQSGGEGRVITVCELEHLWVQADPAPVNQGGPARRLLLSYKWFSRTPPPLFLFDNVPEPLKEIGPFVNVKAYTSRLDVWFEHQRAADHAFVSISSQIFKAKANRGLRLQGFFYNPTK